MNLRRFSVTVSTLALAIAVIPTVASAQTSNATSAQFSSHVASHKAHATVSKQVASPGVYDLTIAISGDTARLGTVLVQIGNAERSVTLGQRGSAVIHQHVVVNGHRITVRATAEATPTIAVRSHKLRSIVRRTSNPKPAASTGSTSPPAPAPAPAAAPAPAPAGPVFPGSPVATSAASGPVGEPASWRLIFDDEFASSSLDLSKWSTGWYGSGITAPVSPAELQCYDPAQVVQAGGELDLGLVAKQETCGGQTRPYASGMVTTSGKFTYTYGFAEARIWLPGSTVLTNWPAFWADGTGSWPTTGELDVLESLGGQACWHFHDASGAPGGCPAQAAFAGGWHTFGADWEPGTVTWYYDGIAVGTVSSAITASPMNLILDLATDNTSGGPIQAPATMRVDYDRVWQH